MSFEHYTQQAAEVLLASEQIAVKSQHREWLPEHLLLALLTSSTGQAHAIFATLSFDIAGLKRRVTAHLSGLAKHSHTSPLRSKRLTSLLQNADKMAQKQGKQHVETCALLFAILDEKVGLTSLFLRSFGVERVQIEETLRELEGANHPGVVEHSLSHVSSTMLEEQSAEVEGGEGVLDKYTHDLTRWVSEGQADPVIGRDDEIRWMMQVLSRRTKNNPVLLGEPGVGRSASVYGLAYRIIREDVPHHLVGKRLVMLDFGALIAGAKFRGEFEERFKTLLHEIGQSKGDIILVLPELHSLTHASTGQGGAQAAGLLKPILTRGEIRCIGISTPSMYKQFIEKDAAMQRLFQPLWVEEPSSDACLAILRGLKSKYELHHGVQITDDALQAAVRLSTRYLPARALPDKAIDLIDEAASRMRLAMESSPTSLDDLNRRVMQAKIEEQSLLREDSTSGRLQLQAVRDKIETLEARHQTLQAQWEREREDTAKLRVLRAKLKALEEEERQAERDGDYELAATLKYDTLLSLRQELELIEEALEAFGERRLLKERIEDEEISEVVADWTGIPVSRMLESERKKLRVMESRLEARVIGQPQAIKAISSAVRRSRSGLADPHRPVGSFLFLGPTGVGKTELAKALADFLFDDERAMLRFDMSEFMEKHTVSRLVGAPPGYAGHDEGGQLTEAIRRQPYAVILFDEIEKAHKDVFNLLLQLLDDGRLTDSQGQTVDFRHTVVILTSNVGAQDLLSAEEVSDEVLMPQVMESLQQDFRPEFLNRIDEILLFHRLSFETICAITDIQIERLRGMLDVQGLALSCTDEARRYLAEKGYDPTFGARPLKRAFLQYVQNPLSMELLDERFKAGDTIHMFLQEGALCFQALEKSEKL